MTAVYDLYFDAKLFARLDCRNFPNACPGLVEKIREFFASWPLEFSPADRARKPLISINAARTSFTIRAPWLSPPLVERGVPSFLCSLAIEMVMAYCRLFPPALHIHAAAVELPAGTSLLLGGNHAGKSSLVARLMAAGQTSLGDDLVGLLPGSELFSFGLAPRLRLPLAPSKVLKDFARANRGHADSRYLFLEPNHLAIAPFGERRKIDFCVFLNRGSSGPAHLRKSAPKPAKLLEHWVLGPGMAQKALEFAQGLDAPFYDLEYADLDEASELLRQPDLAAACQASQEPAKASQPRRRPLRRGPGRVIGQKNRQSLSNRQYRRKEAVVIMTCEDGLYLAGHKNEAIFYLNKLGEIIWQMLEEPLSEAEAASLLGEHFAGVANGVIENDVARLFAGLLESGLIVPTDE